MTTAFKIMFGSAALTSMMMIVAERHHLAHDEPMPATTTVVDDFDDARSPLGHKADRLPLPAPVAALPPPLMPTPAPAVSSQARMEIAREPRRHRDNICDNGRRYFYRGHHQYWRCRR